MTQEENLIAIAADCHNTHYLDESMLDAWWESLSPQEKAAIYEADTDGIHVLSMSRLHPDHKLLRAHAEQFIQEQFAHQPRQ